MISEENVVSRIAYYAEQLKQNGTKSEKGKQAIIVMKELLSLLEEPNESQFSVVNSHTSSAVPPSYSANMDRFMMGTEKEENEESSSGGSLLDF